MRIYGDENIDDVNPSDLARIVGRAYKDFNETNFLYWYKKGEPDCEFLDDFSDSLREIDIRDKIARNYEGRNGLDRVIGVTQDQVPQDIAGYFIIELEKTREEISS